MSNFTPGEWIVVIKGESKGMKGFISSLFPPFEVTVVLEDNTVDVLYESEIESIEDEMQKKLEKNS